jgi:transcriptional regulator with XRE-family HTH domain
MHIVLTEGAAKELGRALRLIRHTRQITLRDTARTANLSPQYINNIERGERRTISDDAFERLSAALGGPESVWADLVVRARISSALMDRGLSADQVTFVMKGVEQRLAEVGYPTTSLGDVLTNMLAPVPESVR